MIDIACTLALARANSNALVMGFKTRMVHLPDPGIDPAVRQKNDDKRIAYSVAGF
ncbi:hypothetical protein D3C71_1734980 [compost metagenome]